MFQAPQFFWRALPIKPWLGEDFWAPRRSFVRVSRSKGGFCPSVAFCAKWTETIAVKGISLRILSWNPDLSNTCFSEKDIKQIGSKRNEIDQRNTSMNQYVQKKCVCVCAYVWVYCGYYMYKNSKDPYWPYLWSWWTRGLDASISHEKILAWLFLQDLPPTI